MLSTSPKAKLVLKTAKQLPRNQRILGRSPRRERVPGSLQVTTRKENALD